MKKTMKKIVCSLLVVVMCLTAAPLQGFVGFDLKVDAATDYKVGDIIQFGSYPQSEVKDEAVIEKLNSLAPAWDDWTSYGYYSGDGNYGSMVQGDWMRYTDISHNGNTYRGVKFIKYRPAHTFNNNSVGNSFQKNHGYETNIVYWFKFEPINWRIVDPETGLIICETIIDSQPLNNCFYYNKNIGSLFGCFSDYLETNYASDYVTSYIRAWLNTDFYNVAFTDRDQAEITKTVINNYAYYTLTGINGYEELDGEDTDDKVFLFSLNEVLNSKFGFPSNTERRTIGSDYSKCQGLQSNQFPIWTLRTPRESYGVCYVDNIGMTESYSSASSVNSSFGIRPALKLKDIATATQKVSSYFMVSSDTYSVDSLNRKETATYKINLLDENSNFLPVDDVTAQNNTTDIVAISTKKISDTELELTVEPLKDGDASISLFNGDGSVEQFFNFIVYSNTTTYRADQVPVTNEELKTNFSRGDMTVDNFEYYFDENKGKYIATMDVYNSSGAIGVVTAHKQNGLITAIEQVDPYKPLPGDFGEFFVYLGTGAVSYLKGESFNYRYAGDSQMTPIEIEVPEDGYISVSCDVKANDAVAICNMISIATDSVFKTVDMVKALAKLGDKEAIAKKSKETLIDKVMEYSTKKPEILEDIVKKLYKSIPEQFDILYMKNLSLLSLDLVYELFENAGVDFCEVLLDTIKGIAVDELKELGLMHAAKKLIEDEVVEAAEESLLKAASLMFKGGEYVNLLNNILGAYVYNDGTGKTDIVFKPKGEDGFICKDTIKVTSDIITDEVLLHTYIIKDTQKEDAFVRKTIYSDFNRGDGLRKEELSIDLNRIIEIHEISLWKNGQEVFDTFTATVEMNLPSYIDRRTCSIYRVEKDGTYTKLDTRIEGNKIIFETNHFSEYILTGVIEDLQETTPCDVHVYDEVRTEPSCTKEGSITYTCYCGDTYTETIGANGHTDSEWIVDKDSTCSAEGSKHIECTVCEEVIRTESIEKLPHSYSSVVTEATCETGGYTTYTCTCGDTYTGDKTPAKGHDYAEGVCKNCGDSKVDNCTCNCHKSGLMGIIWKILRFFYKLFKINPVCGCGVSHY